MHPATLRFGRTDSHAAARDLAKEGSRRSDQAKSPDGGLHCGKPGSDERTPGLCERSVTKWVRRRIFFHERPAPSVRCRGSRQLSVRFRGARSHLVWSGICPKSWEKTLPTGGSGEHTSDSGRGKPATEARSTRSRDPPLGGVAGPSSGLGSIASWRRQPSENYMHQSLSESLGSAGLTATGRRCPCFLPCSRAEPPEVG